MILCVYTTDELDARREERELNPAPAQHDSLAASSVDARNKGEAAINSLPQPDEPNAAERFAEAERVLASSKRHLGDELHGQFSITLADMKPEYVD